jgi:putative hydrolase of HD superfamily
MTFDHFAADDISARLVRKLEFLREAEQLKEILRRNYILSGVRRENDAEHSWHISLMAMLFFEDAADPSVDLLRVLKMLLVHDLVEIDAGDTYAFDTAAHFDKTERERKAADRIFGLLPTDHGQELRTLWEEFDEARTADAQFASALDRLLPLLQNYLHCGTVWKQNGIRPEQVLHRIEPLRSAIPQLADLTDKVIDDAKKQGFFG